MSAELFSLALGGYGLFGVITEVTMKVSDNVPLVMDSLQLSLKKSNDTVERKQTGHGSPSLLKIPGTSTPPQQLHSPRTVTSSPRGNAPPDSEFTRVYNNLLDSQRTYGKQQ